MATNRYYYVKSSKELNIKEWLEALEKAKNTIVCEHVLSSENLAFYYSHLICFQAHEHRPIPGCSYEYHTNPCSKYKNSDATCVYCDKLLSESVA